MKKNENNKDRKVRKYVEDVDLRSEAWDPKWRGSTFIYEPLFGRMIHLYVGSDDDRIKLLAFGPEEKKGDVDPGFAIETVARLGARVKLRPQANGVTILFGPDIYICLRKLDAGSVIDLETLMHECLHAAYIILNEAGVELGTGAEILAHMQGFIFRRLIENLVNGCMSVVKPDGTLEPMHDEDLEMLTKGM